MYVHCVGRLDLVIEYVSISVIQQCLYAAHKCTLLCKSLSTNTHGFYTNNPILLIDANINAHDSSAPSHNSFVPITLHEYPPLRLLLPPNITPRPIRRRRIPTMPVIATIISVSGRIARVAIPIIVPGRRVVLFSAVAISVRAGCVIST